MVPLTTLASHLDELLEVGTYGDVAHNGLQVEGRQEIDRIVLGVSLSLALVEGASKLGADAIITHHGMMWGAPSPVVGPLRLRLRALLASDISLLAYHIPLDAHPVVGNNARLGSVLGLSDTTPWGDYRGRPIGVIGETQVDLDTLVNLVEKATGAPPLVLGASPSTLRRVAVCSGSGGSMVQLAISSGADVLVTGEPGEPAQELAREAGMAVIGAGHYNTERFGVEALGEHLTKRFDVEATFLDLPNPV